jgi:hypothetical protein
VNEIQIIEIIGYTASILVAISLMMSGIVRLRIINLIGAIVFTCYALIIKAYPVAFVNGVITLVDIYYLYEIFKTKEYFDVLEVGNDYEYLNYFLKFHQSDIKKFMPSFAFTPSENNTAFFILRNSIPAGLICAEKRDDGSLLIALDYVIPGYRDMKVAKYVYHNIFQKNNLKKLYSYPGAKKHDKYLEKIGFKKTELNGASAYCLEVNKN